MSFAPLSSLKQVLDDIKEFVSRLSVLASVTWVLSDIRVTPTGTVGISGSITTVTTVTTLTNQTNVGWYSATPQIPATMNIEATLGNIDNIIIS